MNELEWEALASAGRLGSQSPEIIVKAYQEMRLTLNPRVVDQMLGHLHRVAMRHLARGVNRNLPNSGLDIVNDVASNMLHAVSNQLSKDGRGYATAFFPKLDQRLIDQCRKSRLYASRTSPPVTDDETGETAEPEDTQNLNPEETLAAADLIASLPENLRKVVLLHRLGYNFEGAEASISSMLNITPKTARKWLEDAKKAIKENMGISR